MPHANRTLLLFNYDWDQIGHSRAGAALGMGFDEAGFDLFSFPSNARLVWFDMQRFVARLARQAPTTGRKGRQEQVRSCAAHGCTRLVTAYVKRLTPRRSACSCSAGGSG